MNNSAAWVELSLTTLNCNQTQLARKLSVSNSQVSKWKAGEYISYEMTQNFRKILNIEEPRDPEVILWAGSLENEEKWTQLIKRLAEEAEYEEIGYETYHLTDGKDLLPCLLVNVLTRMGVVPPNAYPTELEFDATHDSDLSEEELEEQSADIEAKVEANPYSRTIRDILSAIVPLWAFYEAYILEHLDHDFDEETEDLLDIKSELQDCMIDLAAAKIQEVDVTFAPKIGPFRKDVISRFTMLVNKVKEHAFKEGKPLRAELMDFVRGDVDSLVDDVEVEPEVNSESLHPDIYMNELLIGMRLIQQVLPKVVEALKINVELDWSRFTQQRPTWRPYEKPEQPSNVIEIAVPDKPTAPETNTAPVTPKSPAKPKGSAKPKGTAKPRAK